MINENRKYRVTIIESKGLTTDTNPIILAYVSSRAILKEIENKESKTDLDKLEKIVFSSWEYESNSQIDFDNFTITKE